MSDNTFATARNLGALGGGIPSTIQARGSINRSDKIDVYQFRARAGAAFSATGSSEVRGGSFRLSLFFRDPTTNAIRLGGRQTIRPGREAAPAQTFPALSTPITFFLVLDRPQGNVKYTYRLVAR